MKNVRALQRCVVGAASAQEAGKDANGVTLFHKHVFVLQTEPFILHTSPENQTTFPNPQPTDCTP